MCVLYNACNTMTYSEQLLVHEPLALNLVLVLAVFQFWLLMLKGCFHHSIVLEVILLVLILVVD